MEELLKLLTANPGELCIGVLSILIGLWTRAAVAELKTWLIETLEKKTDEIRKETPTVREFEALQKTVEALAGSRSR